MFAYQTIQLQMSELHECLFTKQYNCHRCGNLNKILVDRDSFKLIRIVVLKQANC